MLLDHINQEKSDVLEHEIVKSATTHKKTLPHGESEGELYTIIVSYAALLSLGRSIGICK
jgi:hypothetical protein